MTLCTSANNFYRDLKEYLDGSGTEYQVLAKGMRVSNPRITRMFKNNQSPTLRTITRISDALGIEIIIYIP